MKFNVEIQIDWIDEENNLDETVQQQVIARIVDQVSAQAIESTQVEITDRIAKKVESLVKKTYDDMMNTELGITDKYGDVIATYKGIKELLKARFDTYLQEQTDEKGNLGAYGTKKRRIDWIVYHQLEQLTKNFMVNAVNEVDAKIKTYLNESLKSKIGSEITQLLKIDQLLEKNGAKKLKR